MSQGNLYIDTLSNGPVLVLESVETKRYVSWHDRTPPWLESFVGWAASSVLRLLVGSLSKFRVLLTVRSRLLSRQIHIAHGVWGWPPARSDPTRDRREIFSVLPGPRTRPVFHLTHGGAPTELFWLASILTAVRWAIRYFISHTGGRYDQLISPTVTVLYRLPSTKTSLLTEFGWFNLAHGTHIYL